MCGLCGFLYKDADRVGPVGHTLHAMLGPMARRGTDSTGIALYGAPQPDSYVVRARIDGNHGTPERVAQALDAAGAVTERSQAGPNMRARITYSGDLGALTDRIEAEPDVEVFSIGRAMEIVKDVGDADAVEAADPYAAFEGSHAIGHTRMATESVVDVAHSHPFWARPFPDISVVHNGHITNYHKLRRGLENEGHRFATGNDSEVIAVYIADKLARGESLEDALRASVADLDGTFAYLISTPDGIGVARDPFALKPLLYAESDEATLIASEEVAIRAVDQDASLVPRELAAGEVRWWLR
jgi:methylamine---glutamate N-methyltransferase subunit A